MAIERQTAHKLWISQLAGANYVKQEGFNPNYIEVNGKNVSRVHLMATVVSKFLSEDGNYGAVTIDDGTETIRIKAFGPDVQRVKPAKIGMIVRAIGKLRQYNEEIYLSPEVLKEIDNPNWLIVRKLELGKAPTIERPIEQSEDGSKKVETSYDEEENMSEKILQLIKDCTADEGANIDDIIKQCGLEEDDAKNMIVGLLKSGDVFEPRKGQLKVLE